jgi:hypothetical protein
MVRDMEENIIYNENYKFKIDNYYFKYIYKYSDYESNINICNINILINKNFTIFLYFKHKLDIKNISLGILEYNKYNNYIYLIKYINNKINKFLLKNKVIIKEIIIYIWEFDFLFNKNLDIKIKRETNIKLKLFNKKIEEIIKFRFDSEIFNNYKLQILIKDLKKTLYVKLESKLEDNIDDCCNHLYYLIKK